MAREAEDREDLLREATALVNRAELSIDGRHVVIGFRRDGAGSVFFDADPVHQFNAAGQWRRGYVDGLLYKAERGRIVQLTLVRTAAVVELRRHELSAAESELFMERMTHELLSLLARLQAGDFLLLGEIPPRIELASRAMDWLDGIVQDPRIALTPRAGR